MTLNQPVFGPSDLSRQVRENITMLLFRMNWRQNDLARATGMTKSKISRKMAGDAEWTVPEIEAIARALGVLPGEMLGEIPEYNEWSSSFGGIGLPHLDSNQEPADLRSVEVTPPAVVVLADYRARQAS